MQNLHIYTSDIHLNLQECLKSSGWWFESHVPLPPLGTHRGHRSHYIMVKNEDQCQLLCEGNWLDIEVNHTGVGGVHCGLHNIAQLTIWDRNERMLSEVRTTIL